MWEDGKVDHRPRIAIATGWGIKSLSERALITLDIFLTSHSFAERAQGKREHTDLLKIMTDDGKELYEHSRCERFSLQI